MIYNIRGIDHFFIFIEKDIKNNYGVIFANKDVFLNL